MKRSIVSIVAAAALALTAISAPAYAQSTNESAKATKVAMKKGQKLCRSKRPDGSVKTWTCGTDQPCCVNHTFNLYTCGSQLLQCL